MTNHQDVIDRWFDIALDGSERKPLRGSNVFGRGDVAYSYGEHFELVRILRDDKGEPNGFLLNGDNYSNTTSRHQSIARACVSRRERSWRPSAIIPYAALGAAGINPADVEIINVSPPSYTERVEEHHSLPPNAILEWVPLDGYRDLFPAEMEFKLDVEHERALDAWRSDQRQSERARAGEWDRYPMSKPRVLAHWLKKAPVRPTWEQYLGHSRGWDREQRERTHVRVGSKLVCWVNARRSAQWDIEYTEDGMLFQRTHRRHWLGESLIRARVAYNVRRTCRWCAGTGAAEGPTPAEWVPPQRRTRWIRGGKDVGFKSFFIDILRDEPGRWHETSWQRPTCSACAGRGRWLETRHRRAYFLSGFDHQEARRCYFFCELPKGVEPTTVDEAYECLKPDPVTLAEAMGRDVMRQGDIFAIPTARFKRELLAAGGTHGRMLPLLGTNHAATEVITLDGVTYARGILHHVPDGRRPDHARVRIGDQWHLIVKNTVPLAAA